MSFIPYGKQHIDNDDIQAVIEVLQSDRLTQGPAIEAFETRLAQYCQANHAVAVNNGTAALHLACRALDIGPDDYVWTSANSFLASANCARFCGAYVDFVDIGPQTYNMCSQALEAKLKQAERQDCLPKAVIPVHFAGQSCDMAAIHALAVKYGFYIIEDAAHAIGGYYRNQPIGNCGFSNLTVFSFHPVKVITTGEGGAVTTNDKDLAHRVRLLQTHGITRDPQYMISEPEGDWYYEQIDLGYNYRITDMQCALGQTQLQKIDDYVQRRHLIAHKYADMMADLPVTLPYQAQDNYSAYHLYPILVSRDKRKAVFDWLRQCNIGVHVHYIPIYWQPYYQQFGFGQGYCPQAEYYYERALSLPIYYELTESEQCYITQKLAEALIGKEVPAS